ncbi:tetratricopeptide repeat protein [Sedimentitalea sp.]|uniref:tetratricopeptide repeat protein n=1 Tax=Sedimentitalea sp. TaxID=2048915 RepID=UPI003297ADE0
MSERTDESTRKDTDAPDAPTAEAVRAQLARILDSSKLQGSQRRRDLLSYLVEETLAGRSDQIKGYTVALAVFGRAETFDPSADPVVRLEAGRLRRALDTYYVDADEDDTVRITIPKGAYVAHFEWLARGEPLRSADNRIQSATDGGEDDARSAGTDASRWPIALNSGARRTGTIALLLAVALLVVAALSWLWPRVETPDVADAYGPVIMVLPFEALNPDEETRLIANGITQDVIHDLMRFPDLRLYSVQASFRENAGADPVALGETLAVSYVLRGNVQSDPGKLRLRAQLVDASTGEVIWSGGYDRAPDPNDLLGMRSELSASVATALGEPFGVMNAATGRRLAARNAPSMASYACVLRAYEYRRTFEDALFVPSLSCLTEVVVRNAGYADAWAMLGWLNLDAARQDMVPVEEHPAHLAAAQDAASRAVTLDSGSQRGFEALAALAFNEGNYAEAERLQREALALNPHDPEALAQLGWRLAARGHWDEGLPYLEQAIARSADPPGWYFHAISVHEYLEGNYADALAAAQRSAKFGSAIGLSLAAISYAGLDQMEAAGDELAMMAKAWPLLARDPAAAYASFQVDDQIIAALLKGLHDAGLVLPATTNR